VASETMMAVKRVIAAAVWMRMAAYVKKMAASLMSVTGGLTIQAVYRRAMAETNQIVPPSIWNDPP
jgi:hypothetical protein